MQGHVPHVALEGPLPQPAAPPAWHGTRTSLPKAAEREEGFLPC